MFKDICHALSVCTHYLVQHTILYLAQMKSYEAHPDKGQEPTTDPTVRKSGATVHDFCVFNLFSLCVLAVDLLVVYIAALCHYSSIFNCQEPD